MSSQKKIREAFRASGVSIAAWAREQEFEPAAVYSVLSGKCTGERGEAHRIAVALGLKHGVKPESSLDETVKAALAGGLDMP